MAVVNVYDDAWSDGTERDGYRSRERSLREELGATRIGATVYELEPGSRICPYHWHVAEEEWLLVLDGDVAVRTPEGERPLARGDVLVFRRGPDGAHHVRNSGAAPARVLMLSNRAEVEICVYPDSGKIGASGGGVRLLNRPEANLDYWDGE